MKALAQGKRRMGCFINRHNYPKAIIISINKESNFSQNKRSGRGAKPLRGLKPPGIRLPGRLSRHLSC
jgi:hypothetical protein